MARIVVAAVIVAFLSFPACNACSISAGNGCCYEIGSCTSISDCNSQVATYLVGNGFGNAPSNTRVSCYQSNCLFYTPSTSCGTIDRRASTCTDSNYCVNVFVSNPPPSPSSSTSSTPSSTQSSPPTSSSNSGCIAENQTVLTQNRGVKLLKELIIGENIFTNNGFQEYIGNIHDGGVYPTVIIHTKGGHSIELTHDHFVKTTHHGFVHANKISVGTLLDARYGKTEVINVTNNTSYVVSPFTRAGTIIVNDIVLSCYATDRSHYLANFVFLPVRTGVIKDVSKYFKALVKVYKMLPLWAKNYISESSTFN